MFKEILMDQSNQRIDTGDEQSMAYWQNEFGVTASQLEDAVRAAGTDPQDVRRHLLESGASAGAS
jgi:hypothetical protein